MALAPGTHLGPYEVIALLGEGGMGQVYRARDARLHRDVAIKVLPAAYAGDPDRRARFEREARAVAALSHPNILSIFDTGVHDPSTGSGEAVLYAVTELLEGETLRDRLVAGGALPIRKTIEIGIQLARGLAAAHDRGIFHRDLKPENVFLLADGGVKILDFGLAKAAADPSAQSAADPTVTAGAMTDPGTVMGTVGYMAPEQVRAQAIDGRTDLFSLGAVLYEMLSGKRAFRRDTAAETMTAILREDPPELAESRADLPPALDRIVRHCLEKNPAERFQTARDVAFALEAFSGTSIASAKAAQAIPAEPARRRWLRRAMAPVLLAIGLTAGYAIAAWLRSASAQTPITFETRTWDPQWITNMRFAPDGHTIVYSAAASGSTPSLFVLRPGTALPQRLGEPGMHLLSVSRSGELAVITGPRYLDHRLFTGTLTQMTLDGAARPLMEGVRDADWSPDGSAMAIVREVGNTDVLEYPVGTKLHEAPGYLSDVRVSPDGARVAFFAHPGRFDDRGWLKVVDRSGSVRTLAGEFWAEQGIAWSPDGRHVYFSASTVGASGYQPFVVDADGDPRLRQAFPSLGWSHVMDVAADGRLLVDAVESRLSIRVLLGGESVERELPWLDLPIPRQLSADGKWLLFSDESASAGLNYAVGWRKTDGSPAVRLGEGNAIALSPDARWALAVVLSPAPRRYVAYPTGAGQPMSIDFSPMIDINSLAFYPDGRLFFCGTEPNKPSRCYARELKGGTPVAVTPEGVTRGGPAPDGRTVGFVTEQGEWQVVQPGTSPKPVPGDHSLDRPIGWSQDSRSIFSVARSSPPAVIERIDVATGARTKVREVMPPDRLGVTDVVVSYISPDGQSYAYGYVRQTSKVIVASGVTGR